MQDFWTINSITYNKTPGVNFEVTLQFLLVVWDCFSLRNFGGYPLAELQWKIIRNHDPTIPTSQIKLLNPKKWCLTMIWTKCIFVRLARGKNPIFSTSHGLTFDPHPTWMGLRTRDFPPDRAPSFKGLSPNHGRSSKSSKFGSPHIRKKSWKKGLDFWRRNSGGGPSNLKHLQY